MKNKSSEEERLVGWTGGLATTVVHASKRLFRVFLVQTVT
jgi:hypothetical protein